MFCFSGDVLFWALLKGLLRLFLIFFSKLLKQVQEKKGERPQTKRFDKGKTCSQNLAVSRVFLDLDVTWEKNVGYFGDLLDLLCCLRNVR